MPPYRAIRNFSYTFSEELKRNTSAFCSLDETFRSWFYGTAYFTFLDSPIPQQISMTALTETRTMYYLSKHEKLPTTTEGTKRKRKEVKHTAIQTGDWQWTTQNNEMQSICKYIFIYIICIHLRIFLIPLGHLLSFLLHTLTVTWTLSLATTGDVVKTWQ